MGRIAEALRKADRERTELVGETTVHGRHGSMMPPSERGSRIGAARSTPARGRCIADIAGSLRGLGEPFTLTEGTASEGNETLGQGSVWDVHPNIVAIHDRRSAITEQYRAARTWLLRRIAGGKHACIAITSSVPREGKSVTTANLAVVMREVRHMNVLAVDCDLRQGTLARLFKIPNAPGLADVLAGRATLEDAISNTPAGNLFILPAGDSAVLNPTELLNSVAAGRVFDEIRDRFHFTLVDTPPVRRLSDVGVIGALCSGIVMVVRMNKTASHLVRQSVHWLRENHLQMLGCIAADCQTRGARYEYEAAEDD